MHPLVHAGLRFSPWAGLLGLSLLTLNQGWARHLAALGRALGGQESQGSGQRVSCRLRPRGTPSGGRAVHSLRGPLQGSLDEVPGIITEVGSCRAAPGHPPLQNVQEGGSVTLTSEWRRAGQAKSTDTPCLQVWSSGSIGGRWPGRGSPQPCLGMATVPLPSSPENPHNGLRSSQRSRFSLGQG